MSQNIKALFRSWWIRNQEAFNCTEDEAFWIFTAGWEERDDACWRAAEQVCEEFLSEGGVK